MAKAINPIKKNIVKQSILEGKSYKRALLDAGYSPNSAIHSSQMAVVKCSLQELAKDFDKAKITAEYVLSGLEREIQQSKNSADRIRALELLGKYLALFTDKQQSQVTITPEQEKTFSRIEALLKDREDNAV